MMLCSTTRFAMTGEVSVSPYPTTRLSPAMSKKDSTCFGMEAPPLHSVFRRPPMLLRIFFHTSASPTLCSGQRKAEKAKDNILSMRIGLVARTNAFVHLREHVIYIWVTAVKSLTRFCFSGDMVCTLV